MPLAHKKKHTNKKIPKPCKKPIVDNNSLFQIENKALKLVNRLPEDLLPVIFEYIPSNIVNVITNEYDYKKYKNYLRLFSCLNVGSSTFGDNISRLLDKIPLDILIKFIKFGGISKYFSEIYHNTNGKTMFDFYNARCIEYYKKCCFGTNKKITYRKDYIDYLTRCHDIFKDSIFDLLKNAREREYRTHDKKFRKMVLVILKNIVYVGKMFAEFNNYSDSILDSNIKFKFPYSRY